MAKLQDFIDSNTAVQSKGVIDLAAKSIAIRRTLQGEENEVTYSVSWVKLVGSDLCVVEKVGNGSIGHVVSHVVLQSS